MTAQPSVLRARWVFPGDRPPIENGLVEIVGGVIVDVRRADRFGLSDGEWEERALVPGLVNAHTHLEFSGLSAPLPLAANFAGWVRQVIECRRSRGDAVTDVVTAGLLESATSGVTTIGEIATHGWSAAQLGPHTPRCVAFRECIALDPALFERERGRVEQHLADLRDTADVTGGLSPHAPYSVHPQLFGALVEIATRRRAPLAVHLAESPDELALLSEGTGPLVDLFTQMGFWQPSAIPRGSRPLDFLRLLVNAPHVLVVHGNFLDAAEIEFLSGRGNFSVVYCPRTHAYFGHPPHPWRRLMERGVRVALGTDSRASNPDLSVWNELLALRSRFPDVAPSRLLEIATRDGAEALGLGDRTGTLTPDRCADIAVVRLGSTREADPFECLLHPDSRPVATFREGRCIAGSG